MTDETIRDLLIEIRTKVDMLVMQGNDHETRLRLVEARPSINPDHEARLRALERSKFVLFGAAAAVGGIAGKLVGLL